MLRRPVPDFLLTETSFTEMCLQTRRIAVIIAYFFGEITVKWLHSRFLADLFFRQWKFILSDACAKSIIRIKSQKIIQMTSASYHTWLSSRTWQLQPLLNRYFLFFGYNKNRKRSKTTLS